MTSGYHFITRLRKVIQWMHYRIRFCLLCNCIFKSHSDRKDVIRLLLEKGTNVFAINNHKEKASEIASGKGYLLLLKFERSSQRKHKHNFIYLIDMPFICTGFFSSARILRQAEEEQARPEH